MAKYDNHYCPVCLGAVDPETGDHWHYCEYEADGNDEQPLTEIQMVDRKLDERRAYVTTLNKRVGRTNKRIELLETRRRSL